MFPVLILAVVSWHLFPLDEAWARLSHDASARDAASFAVDRAEIVRLDHAKLTEWGAKGQEKYTVNGYAVTTFTGPTRVPGDRWHSAYFAVVTSGGEMEPPTLWEVTSGFSPGGSALWFLKVSSCDLASGDPIQGHPTSWRTSSLKDPPSYEAFKTKLSRLVGKPQTFPADTTTAHSPGTTCLYVGDMEVQKLLPLEALQRAASERRSD